MHPPDKEINGVRYLSGQNAFQHFEELYLGVRDKEGRMFSDCDAAALPYLPKSHPLRKEWLMRADSMKRFLEYLKDHPPQGPVLDLGCGNGWFSCKIAELTGENVIGLDVNSIELEQAARVFHGGNIRFCFGDIFEDILEPQSFSLIILNASVQYFPDISALVNRCLYFLKGDGEIHILDTPFYNDERSAAEAAARTRKYYSGMGFPEMTSQYHHHPLNALNTTNNIKVDVLYKNLKLKTQPLKLLLRSPSPFPWIRIVRRR